jgi:ADP-heptose:LPS heptosyltransferase
MIPGIEELVVTKEPLRQLPELDQLQGKQVALKMTGGIGDCIMALGGPAKFLAEYGAAITAIVMPHQGPLMLQMKGVTAWIEAQKFNRPELQAKFDVIIDFAMTFNNSHELRAKSYYLLVAERLGVIGKMIGEFEFPRVLNPKDRVTCLHPGASNPNRRWDNEKWRELAYQLRDRGAYVVWLGTKDEFGFDATRIRKASSLDESLVGQARFLAKSNYFIGGDSGFAHIAGVLGIDGLVLFGNTDPKDVIADYPSLSGVECFSRLKMIPSRALSSDDEKSRKLMDAITVDDVLGQSPLNAIDCTPESRTETEAMRARIAIVGASSPELIDYLAQYYEISKLSNLPGQGSEFDAVLEIREEGYGRMRMRNDTSVTIPLTNFEEVRRALRENLNRE